MKLNKKQALTMLLNLPKYSNMDIDKQESNNIPRNNNVPLTISFA